MQEQDLLSIVSNQGLAVGVSLFLIYWVTSEVSQVLGRIADKLETHDSQAKHIDAKIDQLGCRIVELGDDIKDIYKEVVK